jgi:hypothetical protein
VVAALPHVQDQFERLRPRRRAPLLELLDSEVAPAIIACGVRRLLGLDFQ